MNYDHQYCVFKMKNLTKKEKLRKKKTKVFNPMYKELLRYSHNNQFNFAIIKWWWFKKEKKRKKIGIAWWAIILSFFNYRPPNSPFLPSLFESQSHYRQLLLFGPSVPPPLSAIPQTSSTTIILFSKLLISSLSFLATHTLHTNTYVRINAMYAIACAYIHETQISIFTKVWMATISHYLYY